MIAWIALFISLLALFFHFRQIIRADCGKLGSLIRICVEDAAGEHIAEIKKTAANGELLKHPDTVRVENLEKQLEGYRLHLDRCEQVAGKALGYPWFKDDQKNFPGATEDDGVCVGDHVGDSIVEELAKAYAKIKAKTAANGELLKHPDTLRAEKAERFIKHLISEGIISPNRARSFERD